MAACKREEGETRLRLEPCLAGAAVRRFRRLEIAPQPLDLALLVERAIRRVAVAPPIPFLRDQRRTVRLRPGAVEPVQRCAVGLALGAERDHVGLRSAPLVERGGPLVGASQVVGHMTCADHRAIDDACGHGGDLVCRDRDHGLVQQDHPLLDPAGGDPCLPLPELGEAEYVAVTEALREVGELGEGPQRDVDVTGVQGAQC